MTGDHHGHPDRGCDPAPGEDKWIPDRGWLLFALQPHSTGTRTRPVHEGLVSPHASHARRPVAGGNRDGTRTESTVASRVLAGVGGHVASRRRRRAHITIISTPTASQCAAPRYRCAWHRGGRGWHGHVTPRHRHAGWRQWLGFNTAGTNSCASSSRTPSYQPARRGASHFGAECQRNSRARCA